MTPASREGRPVHEAGTTARAELSNLSGSFDLRRRSRTCLSCREHPQLTGPHEDSDTPRGLGQRRYRLGTTSLY